MEEEVKIENEVVETEPLETSEETTESTETL